MALVSSGASCPHYPTKTKTPRHVPGHSSCEVTRGMRPERGCKTLRSHSILILLLSATGAADLSPIAGASRPPPTRAYLLPASPWHPRRVEHAATSLPHQHPLLLPQPHHPLLKQHPPLKPNLILHPPSPSTHHFHHHTHHPSTQHPSQQLTFIPHHPSPHPTPIFPPPNHIPLIPPHPTPPFTTTTNHPLHRGSASLCHACQGGTRAFVECTHGTNARVLPCTGVATMKRPLWRGRGRRREHWTRETRGSARPRRGGTMPPVKRQWA